ncbi:MAG TPA: VWA domain-containing protein [Verrucomicrobiota bacterium]|nr:VWA domain-containing protein [Verrucomicrobiota bacterium]
MTFAHPQMLWLLAAVLPLLAWFLVWAWRKKQAMIAQFVQSRLLAQLTVGVSARRQKLRLVLLGTAVALILFALARPQLGFAWEEVHQRGLDILVAVDTSRSMLATDVAPSRLARAKLAALDLMRAARSDRLGLIAFAGTAFLQCPLTLDDNAFAESVNYLDVDTIPQGGTAIAEAIDTAIRAFKESEDNHKILVLFTDGEDHEAGVLEAAERAADAGILVFPVGVGTLEGDRLRVVDEQGKTTYLSDFDGQTVVSKLNMQLLEQIAAKTKGDMLRLSGPDPLKLLYEVRLAPLPRSEHSARRFRQYYERFQWPLGLAILLLLAEMFVNERQRVRRTEATVNAANAALRRMVTLLALLLLPWDAHASAHKAFQDFESGNFSNAEQEYRRLLEKKPNDPRLHYNAGTAAYRAGRLDEAATALSAAVLSSDPQLLARAYYNLANTQYRLGERAPAATNTLAHWEDALRHYDSSLKLDPKDADAQFNRDLVARKIEELRKQQQQQQQQQQQDKNQEQEQSQDQKSQSQPNQDQNDPRKQQQQERDRQEQQQQERQQSQSEQEQQQQNREKQQQQKKNERESGQPRQQAQDPSRQDKEPRPEAQEEKGSKPEEQPEPHEREEAQPKPRNQQPPASQQTNAAMGRVIPGQMTPEQARQLLEAARSEERPMIFVPPEAQRAPSGLRRDW